MHQVFGPFLVALSVLTAIPAFAAETLCAADETVLFSCQTPRGIGSLCRIGTRAHTVLHYRFGEPGHVQLRLPQPDRHSAASFRVGLLTDDGAYVRFHNGRYRYTVFDSGKGGTAGIAVDRDGQEAAGLLCRPDSVRSAMSADSFHLLRLKTVDAGDEFVVPVPFGAP